MQSSTRPSRHRIAATLVLALLAVLATAFPAVAAPGDLAVAGVASASRFHTEADGHKTAKKIPAIIN